MFGASPFVVNGGGSVDGASVFVVASPCSLDLVKLPPPAQHANRSSKVNHTAYHSTNVGFCLWVGEGIRSVHSRMLFVQI